MRRITARAARTALGSAAALATLALPLVLGTLHTGPATGTYSVQATETTPDSGVDEFGDPIGPKPKPGDPTGSWVWDKLHP
ncbi:hypothetical protein [Streptomyces geranii]|uniref:hypothetical protein n=1 Tax=Streptomyces geranii TaxID=2058923 RepID=UPI000D0244A3|nr:hypothetical protein [Streptomyces geranii]